MRADAVRCLLRAGQPRSPGHREPARRVTSDAPSPTAAAAHFGVAPKGRTSVSFDLSGNQQSAAVGDGLLFSGYGKLFSLSSQVLYQDVRAIRRPAMKLAVALLAGAVWGVPAAAQGGAVVTGKDAPISAIQSEEAKKIFLGRESSIGGHDVTPVYQKVGAVSRADFDGKVLDKPSADLAGYWSKLVFTGRATTVPKEVDGDSQMKTFVNTTPGTIGYISDAAVDDSVKVLFKY